ncbi:hypothetical protein FGO68_gene6011 [Halteria grandinella]|uniref:Uncharacterized protein n=1 Tax=Halteria grandinella TaxID=5974 RepID=A0A8J8NAS7_HALGN|nr:hypothetical protein FGO68_gene6011 [Halteria grandinella]
MKPIILRILVPLLVLLYPSFGQVTTHISQTSLRLLPDTYTEINLISQDVTNEIKQDTTDISVSFNLTNVTSYYPPSQKPLPLNVVEIYTRADYECYMTLVNWRVPVRSVVNLDTFFQLYNGSMGCGGFALRVAGGGDQVYSYFKQRDDLFTQPLNINISNLMVIVDNTVQLSNLKAFMQNGTSANAKPVTHTQYLCYDIEVVYKLSDRWFIMTVTFGCADALALITAVGLFVQFKRTKKQHGEFRRRREKWVKYDQDYDNKGAQGGLVEYGDDPLGQQLLEEDQRNTESGGVEPLPTSSPTEYGLRMLSPSTNLNPTILSDQSPLDSKDLASNRLEDGASRHQPPGYQASFQQIRKAPLSAENRGNSSVMVKSVSNVTNGTQPNQEIVMNMESEENNAETYDGVGGLPQSSSQLKKPFPHARVSKQNSDSVIQRESGVLPAVKYKAPKKRSNLFD